MADTPGEPHWFEALADRMGPAYLRYAFTKGTEAEVDVVLNELGVGPGALVVDLGCGPGRHSRALAARGVDVVGVDVARRFLEVAAGTPATGPVAGGAAPGALHWVRADATRLPLADSTVAGVVSLCQGAFGVPPLGSDDSVDAAILAEVTRVLVPGGRLVLTAFSAYFQVRYLEDTDNFDALAGRNQEVTEIHDPEGRRHPAELHTSCYTPRELRLLTAAAGLATDAIWSVRPGGYEHRGADLDHPEFLVVATKR